jgi:hypothetical protein
VAQDFDRDLRSWAYSSRGNRLRQRDPSDAAAVADLDRAVDLAQLPNEKANAVRRRSLVELDHSRPLAASELLAEALKIESTASEHFNSDRGQPMLLNSHYAALQDLDDKIRRDASLRLRLHEALSGVLKPYAPSGVS